MCPNTLANRFRPSLRRQPHHASTGVDDDGSDGIMRRTQQQEIDLRGPRIVSRDNPAASTTGAMGREVNGSDESEASPKVRTQRKSVSSPLNVPNSTGPTRAKHHRRPERNTYRRERGITEGTRFLCSQLDQDRRERGITEGLNRMSPTRARHHRRLNLLHRPRSCSQPVSDGTL